jgi:hypothetical protein
MLPCCLPHQVSLRKEAGPAPTPANARQLLAEAAAAASSSQAAAAQAPATATDPSKAMPTSIDNADSQGKKKTSGPPPGGYYSKMINTQGATGASVAVAAVGDKPNKPAADNTKNSAPTDKSTPKPSAPSKVCEGLNFITVPHLHTHACHVSCS